MGRDETIVLIQVLHVFSSLPLSEAILLERDSVLAVLHRLLSSAVSDAMDAAADVAEAIFNRIRNTTHRLLAGRQ